MNDGWCFPAEGEPLQYCTVPKEACQPRPHSQPRVGASKDILPSFMSMTTSPFRVLKLAGTNVG